jgi:hypothetical protein
MTRRIFHHENDALIYTEDLRLFVVTGENLTITGKPMAKGSEFTIDSGAKFAIAMMEAVKSVGGQIILQSQARLAALPPILMRTEDIDAD